MAIGIVNKKVLYVVPSWFTLYYPLRGQLAYLKSIGFDIDVACEDDPRSWEAAQREGVKLYPIRIDRYPSFFSDWSAFWKLYRLISANRYSIVNCCTKKGGMLSAMAGRLNGVPKIVYVNRGVETRSLGSTKQFIFSQFERVISLCAHRVLFISASNRQSFQKRSICSTKKMVLIGQGSSNGVDSTVYQKTEEILTKAKKLCSKYRIPEGSRILGYVGRLTYMKGIKELSEAWQIVRNEHPDTHLIVVSPPEVDLEIEDSVSKMKSDPMCHFVGFMTDPRPAYAAMDCLVFPSHGEGFPNAILEAGAMEVPCLGSRTLGVVDAIVHERTGILVESKNSLAIAQGMRRVLNDRETAKAWGRNARLRCISDFKPEKIWQGLADLYLLLASGNSWNSGEIYSGS
ncbi:MAG TPA: glycosyltransferase family 4 protein [Terriglobia bacterium]|nr:glycosyltransferase family 4 protein [Terriglobia bacterium]